MELYGVASSRARRALWTLEEIGAEFTFHKVDVGKGEHRQPAFLAINPNGKVPVLVDGDLTLFESGAICNHIALQHPQAHLLPEPGSRDAALCQQWLFWVVSELEQPLWNMAKHRFVLPQELRLPAMLEVAAFEWRRPAEILAEHLTGREYMVGESFSLADIFVSHTLNWARGAKVDLRSDVAEDYLDRMLARPAFKRTLDY
ncbi:MAG: glutathione S-transferase family protein [Gammaproteobacteria bacterium]|nr:glutathione S-transferase family protein [Gammaproteobacteria bacterium]